LCGDRLGNAGRLVARQIVEHDNVLPPQGRGQHLLDMSAETLTVDGAVEESQPAAGSAIAACHIGGGPSLVDEHQVVGIA
jgi:hypothetical protein